MRIESYAMIGDCVTCALSGSDGSIDWLCLPRFNDGACFAALLGAKENGRWLIAPAAETRVSRRYLDRTLILETIFETDKGKVALTEFMVPGAANATLVRSLRGVSGHVDMHMELTLRFDYGATVPWVTKLEHGHGLSAIAGPDMVLLHAPVKIHGANMHSEADFSIRAGQTMSFVLQHGASHLEPPVPPELESALKQTTAYWESFAGTLHCEGEFLEAIERSLITLKALSYAPTGGIVAAATTSLPEQIGGGRNWDYRFCWLRDATLTLFALMHAGCRQEAVDWSRWLHRSIAGSAAQIQIMYGLHGERDLTEREIAWLPGYENSQPVRVGNAAAGQLQLDVFGEVMHCLHQARRHGLRTARHGWDLQKNILEHLETVWEKPDQGMWESRGGPQHYTFSKIMAWVAVDRMIADATHHHLSGPVEEWRSLRKRMFDRVMDEGFSARRNAFTQYFGSEEMDASLLLIAGTGFLPPDHPRVLGTIEAVEKDLLRDGFVLRYRTETNVDGLPPGEGAFLACTFWMVDAYVLLGRKKDAETMFRRLLALRNDVGLLAEEYEPQAGRQVGNFPQAFSHVALVSAAMTLRDGFRRY